MIVHECTDYSPRVSVAAHFDHTRLYTRPPFTHHSLLQGPYLSCIDMARACHSQLLAAVHIRVRMAISGGVRPRLMHGVRPTQPEDMHWMVAAAVRGVAMQLIQSSRKRRLVSVTTHVVELPPVTLLGGSNRS